MYSHRTYLLSEQRALVRTEIPPVVAAAVYVEPVLSTPASISAAFNLNAGSVRSRYGPGVVGDRRFLEFLEGDRRFLKSNRQFLEVERTSEEEWVFAEKRVLEAGRTFEGERVSEERGVLEERRFRRDDRLRGDDRLCRHERLGWSGRQRQEDRLR